MPSITYKLQDSIEVNSDTITEGKLLCDEKYMIPEQENPCWYFETEFVSIYTTVSLKIILLPKLNVEVIKNTLELHRDVSTLSKI